MSLYSSSSASFSCCFYPTSSSQMAEIPRELSSWFSTPFILKIPQIKRPVVSRFQQGWQDPLYKGSCVGALSPKEESSYMGAQVHNLLVKHFHFPLVSHWIQLIHFSEEENILNSQVSGLAFIWEAFSFSSSLFNHLFMDLSYQAFGTQIQGRRNSGLERTLPKSVS